MSDFAVIRFASGWRILFEGRWLGRFNFEVDAVDAALRLAGDVRRTGRTAGVLVQNRFGEISPAPEDATVGRLHASATAAD